MKLKLISVSQPLIGCFKRLSAQLPLTLIQCCRHCCMYTNQSNAALRLLVGPSPRLHMLLFPGDEKSADNHVIRMKKKHEWCT